MQTAELALPSYIDLYNAEEGELRPTHVPLGTFLSWFDKPPSEDVWEELKKKPEDLPQATPLPTTQWSSASLEDPVGEEPNPVPFSRAEQQTLIQAGAEWLRRNAAMVEVVGLFTLAAVGAIIASKSPRTIHIESAMQPPQPPLIAETTPSAPPAVIVRTLGLANPAHRSVEAAEETKSRYASLHHQAHDISLSYQGIPMEFTADQWPEIAQWDGQIGEMITKYQLPNELVAPFGISWKEVIQAMMWQESKGNPLALNTVSSVHDVGLMQINMGNSMGYTEDELFNPTNNLDAAGELLQEKISIFGTLRGALQGYGPADNNGAYPDLIIPLAQHIHTFSVAGEASQ